MMVSWIAPKESGRENEGGKGGDEVDPRTIQNIMNRARKQLLHK